MKTYRRGESPKLYGIVKKQVIDDNGNLSDGALVDPASIQIIIENPIGVIVQALVNMDKLNAIDGKFAYDGYTIPTDAVTGKYNYEIRAKDAPKGATGAGSFEVIEEIA